MGHSQNTFANPPQQQWTIASRLSLGAIAGLIALLGLIVKWKLSETDLAWAELPASSQVLGQSPDEAGLPPAQPLEANAPSAYRRRVTRSGWETAAESEATADESARFSGIRFAGHNETATTLPVQNPEQSHADPFARDDERRPRFPAPRSGSENAPPVRSLFDGPEELPAGRRMMSIEASRDAHSQSNHPAPLPTLGESIARPMPSGDTRLTPSLSIEQEELPNWPQQAPAPLPLQSEPQHHAARYESAPVPGDVGGDPFAAKSLTPPQHGHEVAELPATHPSDQSLPSTWEHDARREEELPLHAERGHGWDTDGEETVHSSQVQQVSGFDPAGEPAPTPAEPAPFQLQPTPIKETQRPNTVDELDLEADWPAQTTTTPPEGFGGGNAVPVQNANPTRQFENFGSLDLDDVPQQRGRPAAIPASNQNNYLRDSTAVTQTAAAEDDLHEVQSGDNYWTISKRYYGTARFFGALAEYNKPRIPDPNKMKPGMYVLVPDLDVLYERFPKITGVDPRKITPADTRPGFFVDRDGQPAYRVGKGDTLTDIAQNHLGRSSRWVQIYSLNRDRIPKTEALKIGTVLRLPSDASQVVLAPREDLSR